MQRLRFLQLVERGADALEFSLAEIPFKFAARVNLLDASFATAILLLLLTGCRHSEILNLKWSDIHGLRIKLSDAKTGRRTVWLGTEARAVIDHLALTRRPKIEWLFWNWKMRKQIKSVGAYWHQVQERAGIMGLRVHDIRHTFASHAVQRAETIPMVGRLLGHAKVSSTLRYAHLDDEHALAASQRIADAIEKMMDDGLPQVYPTTKYDALDWTQGSPAE
jgi:integrase